MRPLTLAVLAVLSIPNVLGHAATPPPPTRADIYRTEVRGYISKFNPEIPQDRVWKLAYAISGTADRYDISAKHLTYILIQESALRSGIKNKSNDYGIAQINWPTWGHYLKLDKERLQNDDAYGIDVAGRILRDLKSNYGHEAKYWSRYHNHHPKFRVAYEHLIFDKMEG